MADSSNRPDEVFASLASALALQTGFGLCFLFTDDALGLNWLRNRLKEHLEADRELSQSSSFRQVTSVNLNAVGLVKALSEPAPNHRTLVWCDLPPDTRAAQALLVRVNEQRQRLVNAAHFYVFALGQAAAHDTPAWAPDLWSVRTLSFRSQNQSRWVRGGSRTWQADTAAAQGPASHQQPSNYSATSTSTTIDTWKRIYAAWLANPAGSAPSPDLALAASHQALVQRQFDEALAFAQQAHQVATTDLGRANALRSLGDLKRRLGAVSEAQDLYLQAIGLYEKEQHDLGQGYAWAELARLWEAGDGKERDARDAARKALYHAQLSGSPPMLSQIINILAEVGLATAAGKLVNGSNTS